MALLVHLPVYIIWTSDFWNKKKQGDKLMGYHAISIVGMMKKGL